MFFEFETNSNQSPRDLSTSTMSKSVSTTPNQMAKKSPAISPLAIDSSSSILSNYISSTTTPTSTSRHRRYSMHSFMTQSEPHSINVMETLRESNGKNIIGNSNCDLALITKKKLLQLNANNNQNNSSISSSSSSGNSNIEQSSYSLKLKSDDEGFIEPDVKLNQTFTKRSNSDLRKEVLLASMHRSLSASSEDLLSLSNNNNKSFNNTSDAMVINDEIECDDYDMMDSIVRDRSPYNQMFTSSTSKSGAIPIDNESKVNYTPSETQINQQSKTTFTSTTSMAGSKNQHHHPHHQSTDNQNNNQQKQNQQSNNLITMNETGIMAIADRNCNNNSLLSTYYYYTSTSPSSSMSNICQTVQSSPSPIRTSLMKKRMYSTSPSKPYSPPLSFNHHSNINNSNNNQKDFNHQQQQQQSIPLSSPDWEKAFKRLKVMHAAAVTSSSSSSTSSASSSSNTLATAIAFNQQHSQQQPPHQHEQLNELAQDFHRLKTPFT